MRATQGLFGIYVGYVIVETSCSNIPDTCGWVGVYRDVWACAGSGFKFFFLEDLVT